MANDTPYDTGDPNCGGTEVCIRWDSELGQYILTSNYGNDKPFPATPVKVTGGVVIVNNECFFDIFVNKVRCDRVALTDIFNKLSIQPEGAFNPVNCQLVIKVGENTSDPISLLPLLQKYNVVYDPNTHSYTTTINGVQHQAPQVLNCGAADIVVDPDTGFCRLRYRDEKGNIGFSVLPQTIASYDPVACTFTLQDPAKPSVSPLVIPAGVPTDQFQAKLDENCDIVLCYKDVERKIVLPNFVVSVTFNSVDCTVTTRYWKGDPVTIPYLSAIDLQKQDNGSAILTVKGVSCAIFPPADPDGYSEQGLVQADGTDGNGNPIIDFAGNPIAPNTLVINYYNAAGDYVNSKDFKVNEGMYVGDILCNEDADGVACAGVTTHVLYDGQTCLPVKKVSHCSSKECVQWVTRFNVTTVGGTAGGVILSPTIEAGLEGEIVEMYGQLDFTLPKASDVEFVGTHQWFASGVSTNGLFEIEVDGSGIWISPSGGTNEISGDQDLIGAAEWPMPEYRCIKNMAKGPHTIKARYRFIDVQFNASALKRLQGNISDFSVNWIKDECKEVIL